jgi:nucleolar protein 4
MYSICVRPFTHVCDPLFITSPIETASGIVPSRASRLIVRNLPFDVTEQDLRAIFLPYGPIHSIHIPVAEVDDVNAEDDVEHKGSFKAARSKGFAFVWMLSKKDAESALEKCNGMKVVAGMASDIVSDKQKKKKQRREEKKRQNITSEDGEEVETVEELEQTGSGAKERVIAVDWALSKERWAKEKEKLEEMADDMENDVEMDVEESGASASENSDVDSEHEQLGIHEEAPGDEGGEDDGEDSEHPEPDSDDESPKKPQLPHTDTGNTLFIRNVPFTATEDEIRTLYVSPFCSMQSPYTLTDSGPSVHFDMSALQSIPKLSVPGEPDLRAFGTRKTRTKPSSRAKFCV